MKNFKYLILIFLPLIYVNSQDQYNWEEVITPDTAELYRFTFDTTGNLYIGTNKGVYFSEDDNQWQFIGPNDFASYIYINSNNTIYAGMNELYRSYDNGTTWDSIFYYTQGGITSIYTIGDSIIFVGTWGGIFRSADSGQTWNHVLFSYNSEVFKAIVANSEGVLFAGSTNFTGNYSPGGVYKSDDNGETWELIGLDYYFISAMVIDSEDRIYACARGNYYTGKLAVFKSLDNGISWEIIYENNTINTITRNEYNEVSIGCDTQDGTQGGVFCSYDEGETWEDVTNNLPTSSIYYIKFSPNQYLFLRTKYDYRLFKTESPVNISQHQFAKHDSFTVYPNPAKDKLNLIINKYNIEKIYITDLSGKLIKNMRPLIGENGVEINISDLPPSVYLIHYKSDHNISTVKFIKY